jgi:hypothetical protein
MKTLSTLILGLILLSSCVKYAEPKSLSLSGEYVIDKIVYENRDNNNLDQVIYPGETYVNTSETAPLDTIFVGQTRLSLDYAMIYFDPVDNSSTGSTSWGKQFTYYVQGHNNVYDLGYIVFDYDGTRRIWKIIDDGVESLTIRTSGSYDYGSNDSGEQTVIHLTRVGP